MAAEYLERMGTRMRERREELGMSRPDVARAMPGKTNENQIYRWEKGLHRPEDDALEAIANVLQVSGPGWFFAQEPDKTETPDPLPALGVDEQIARMEARLAGLIETQNGLLARQSQILEGIEAAIRRDEEAAQARAAAEDAWVERVVTRAREALSSDTESQGSARRKRAKSATPRG